jgi:hypothetical protein
MTEGPECMPIFTLGLCSMIRDCLVPTTSHKQRFSSLENPTQLPEICPWCGRGGMGFVGHDATAGNWQAQE